MWLQVGGWAEASPGRSKGGESALGRGPGRGLLCPRHSAGHRAVRPSDLDGTQVRGWGALVPSLHEGVQL